MYPALSIIVFTIASGVGMGLLALVILLDLLGAGLARGQTLIGIVAGLALATIGLCASVFHLANPRKMWLAFSRFRSSWLSREAVFAVLAYVFALIYLADAWLRPGIPGLGARMAGLAAVLLAAMTIFATGMIYACLRTIRQWNNALVPANYLLLGLASGALLLTAITAGGPTATVPAYLALGLLLAGALGKALYFLWIGKPEGPTINTATGFTRARVRLLDIGHSSATFLTREFGYRPPAALIVWLRWLVFLLGFAAPIVLIVIVLERDSVAVAALAVTAALLGSAIERWLFFAEARHVVNLFHGDQRC